MNAERSSAQAFAESKDAEWARRRRQDRFMPRRAPMVFGSQCCDCNELLQWVSRGSEAASECIKVAACSCDSGTRRYLVRPGCEPTLESPGEVDIFNMPEWPDVRPVGAPPKPWGTR